MPVLNVVPLFTFVMITTYTPGPNNISSASMGLLFGYAKSLPYLAGIASGFVMIMFLCGSLSGFVNTIIPSLSIWLRWVGCAYILWLAFSTLQAGYSFSGEHLSGRLGFSRGMMLQILNPKVIIYGLTLYTTFLSPIVTEPFWMSLSAFLLAFNAWLSVSLWALFGSALKKYVYQPQIRRTINLILCLLLVYTALSILHI
ncbi:MAG: LysE family transporter [Synergistales bacterium]|nr:LysE family transporter [Synergistales bacterium]